MRDMVFVIARERLPSDEEERMDAIHDYFPDHKIEVTDTATHYHLRLQRSNYDYCEEMVEGLRWLRVERDELKNFYLCGQQSFLCLLESWVPYGWSQFMAKNRYRPDRLSLLHLDDHRDLMSPKLSQCSAGWRDMLTNGSTVFSNPDSIKRAVQSGAITLGSMMTPLLHYLDNVDVYHLAHGKATI